MSGKFVETLRRHYGFAKSDYLHNRRRQRTILIMAAIVTAVVCLYALSMTQYPLTFMETLRIIWDGLVGTELHGYTEEIEHSIIWDDYIPRILGGFLIGAILGICGAVMQSIINNPLADPYTTGISSGASLGVGLFIAYGITILPIDGDWGMIANAFVFSLIPCAIIMLFAALGKASSNMMILTGIGVMMVFSSCTQLIMFSADPESVSEIYEWNVGSLGLLENENLPFLVASFAILCVSMAFLSKYITILTTGDKMAKSLGVNAKRVRLLCFLIISLCVALAVCFSGSIGFVGLVIPHISRILVGSSKNILALSGILGGLMLVVCDAVARLIILGGLPVGVITAAIGSPILIYFLVRSKRNSYYG